MDVTDTVVIALFLIGTPIGIYSSNPCKNYDEKITKIRVALFGYLENAVRELRNQNTGTLDKIHERTTQEERYREFIQFMQNSQFLHYANQHEELVRYEVDLRKILNHVLYSTAFLVIPVILIQINGIWPLGAFLFELIGFVLCAEIMRMYKITRIINSLYSKHVITQHSFGGYNK